MSRAQARTGLRLRQATRADTPAAQATYQRIRDHLGETVDYPHWHSENHPTPAEVQAWVTSGQLYLAVTQEDGIAGVMALDHDAPEAYRQAAWSIEASGDEVLVVHALGVNPTFLRQGVGRFLVEGSVDVARQKSSSVVRLDTYVGNYPARSLYTRHGFTDLGVHTLRYEGTALSQFHLFEFVL